jgi:hypothetical protein
MPAAVSLQLNAPTIPSFIVMRETLTSSRAVMATGSMVIQYYYAACRLPQLASAVCSTSLAAWSRTVRAWRTSLLKKWCFPHRIVGIGLAARNLVKSWLHPQHAFRAPRAAASI